MQIVISLTLSLRKYFSIGNKNVFSGTDVFTSTLNLNHYQLSHCDVKLKISQINDSRNLRSDLNRIYDSNRILCSVPSVVDRSNGTLLKYSLIRIA